MINEARAEGGRRFQKELGPITEKDLGIAMVVLVLYNLIYNVLVT